MRLYHFVILFLISLSCICIPTTKYSLEVMKMKDESCSLSLYLCFISVQYGIKIIWTSLLNKLHPIDGFKLSKDEHIVSWIAWWVYRQYTQKIKPSTRKGRKNLEKSRLATIKSIQKIQKRGIFQIFKNCWDHSTSDQIKRSLKLWFDNSSSLKVLWLRSPQMF